MKGSSMLYFFLMNYDDRYAGGRFPRIRKFCLRLLNIALAGVLVFTLTGAFLLALSTF